MKVLRKFFGLEPDFWDFQVIDIVERRHYVFYNGINPEGERIEIEEEGRIRRGRGIWFKEVVPDPHEGKHEEVLLFMDSVFNWHEYINPGDAERFATVGKLSFKLVPEFGIKESKLPIISKLRKKEGTQYILVAELLPYIPSQEEINKWLQYVESKKLLDNLPEITANMEKMRLRIKDLESKNLLLQEEARRLRNERDALLREVARLRNEYSFIRIQGEIQSLMEKLQIQQIEQKKEEIEKPSFIERLRRKPNVEDEIKRLDEEIAKLREELKKAREEGG